MTSDLMTSNALSATERQDFGVGDTINWDAAWENAVLWVELPFWLMVPDCSLTVDTSGHAYKVDVVSTFSELYAEEIRDSKSSCVYVGHFPPRLDPALAQELEDQQAPILPRKCKTVLRIYSRCNADVFSAADEQDSRRSRDANYYLAALCEAHLAIVNQVIQHYRVATYDYFPHEVSPWDVPIWMVDSPRGFIRSLLLPYAGWDLKPQIGPMGGELQEYRLISPDELQNALSVSASPGELELLDARTLMERGDYSGAVRRITTALEVITEAVLADELRKKYSEEEVQRRLEASRNDYPGRVRQYEKLSKRAMPRALRADIEKTRSIRHSIVHGGLRISFAERGRVQRAVDTGRWAFNWIENRPDRTRLRETKLAAKSIGRHFTIFDAELTADGITVQKPDFLDEEER